MNTAIAAGENVKLGADITLTDYLKTYQNITLDLNGHTLNTGAYMFVVFSDVTLKDTSGNESGKITGTGTSYRVQLGSKTTEAILTVESGTIEAPAQYGVNIQPKGTLIMNGGND